MFNVCVGWPLEPTYRINMCVWMLPTCTWLHCITCSSIRPKRDAYTQHCMGWVAGEMLQCVNRQYRVSTLRGWVHLFLTIIINMLFLSVTQLYHIPCIVFLIWSYGSSMIKFYLCALGQLIKNRRSYGKTGDWLHCPSLPSTVLL